MGWYVVSWTLATNEEWLAMRLQFSDCPLLIPLRKSIFDVERSMFDVGCSSREPSKR